MAAAQRPARAQSATKKPAWNEPLQALEANVQLHQPMISPASVSGSAMLLGADTIPPISMRKPEVGTYGSSTVIPYRFAALTVSSQGSMRRWIGRSQSSALRACGGCCAHSLSSRKRSTL
jgi:hypothetical protein